MKKFLIIALSLMATMHAQAQDRQNEWENPKVLDRNKEEGRSFFILYGQAAQAEENNSEASGLYKSLSGDGKFNLVKHLLERPEDF